MEIELKKNSKKTRQRLSKKIWYKNFYLIDNETKLTNTHTHRQARGFPRHRFYDNLLRYEKQIGLYGYKEYIESIKKGMIIFDGI